MRGRLRAAAVLLALLLVGCGTRPAATADWGADFRTADGAAFALGPGESPFVVVFWSSWAPPALALLRDIGTLADRAQVVTVMLEARDPRIERLAAGDLLVVEPADDSVVDRYDIGLLPTVLVLDRQGRVAGRYEGFSPGLVEEIGRALAPAETEAIAD